MAAGEEDLSLALDGDGVVDTGVGIGEADQDIVEVRCYHVGSVASSDRKSVV